MKVAEAPGFEALTAVAEGGKAQVPPGVTGFGGALGGYVLTHYGYVPNVAQTERALDGIRYSASIFPAITFAICAVCLFFYRIDKRLELQMADELTERRKQFSHTPVPVVP
jgi:Na+/melibiose symporter-like transporter